MRSGFTPTLSILFRNHYLIISVERPTIQYPVTLTPQAFRERTEQPVDLHKLETSFVLPHHFAKATFENYIPDPGFPSQQAARDLVKSYAHDIKREHPGMIGKLFGRKAVRGLPHGLYLDGGFGVGKTHLLAAAFHVYHGKKAYLSFQELMFYVGLKRLDGAVESLGKLGLLVIDEFELDDPANTRIITNLLNQLFAKGVHVLTSSNTPPGALGEGKFSVHDFSRELGELTSHFTLVRVNGEDYRMTHPHGSGSTRWSIDEPLASKSQVAFEFDELLSILSGAHPMRVRQSLHGIHSIKIVNVRSILDPHHALRLVYFIDKIYDNDVTLSVEASVPLKKLFSRNIFHGGDTKKYLRALSRLEELTQG